MSGHDDKTAAERTPAENALEVLLVEDNPGDARLIEKHLDTVDDPEVGELALSHVETLTEALDRLDSEPVDLVLLDLGLPESSGIDTAERVVGAYPDLPVVVLTGLRNHEVAVEAIRAGAQDYLNKDEHIDGPMLARAIRYAVERKAREQQLELRTERLEEFASVISHELRNPLNIARGYAALAREDDADGEAALDQIETALDRMDTLVEKLLQLSTLSRGEGLGAVDLRQTIERSWATVATAEARLEIEDGLPSATADATQLRALFEHLLRNAVEHGSTNPRSQAPEDAGEHGSTNPASQTRQDAAEHGSTNPASQAPEDADTGVTVVVGSLEDGDGFYVADDGPGIPPEERSTILEQNHSTGGADPRFGLTIVRNIVEDHGWTIRVVESESGGARFEIGGLSNSVLKLGHHQTVVGNGR